MMALDGVGGPTEWPVIPFHPLLFIIVICFEMCLNTHTVVDYENANGPLTVKTLKKWLGLYGS